MDLSKFVQGYSFPEINNVDVIYVHKGKQVDRKFIDDNNLGYPSVDEVRASAMLLSRKTTKGKRSMLEVSEKGMNPRTDESEWKPTF